MTLAIVPSANRPPAANVMTPETQALLTRLAPDDGFCRVASTKGKGSPWRQHILTFSALQNWSRVPGIRNHNQYFGVAVRDADRNALEIHALFADIDFSLLGEDAEQQVRTAIANFPLAPSALVNSGGGGHLYLFLQEPASLRTEDERAHIRSLLRRLTVLLPGADILCAFPECVLRLPDSNNVKYTPPRPVTTEYVHVDRAYSLAQFETLLADVPEPGESPEERVRLSESLNTQDTIPEGQRDHTLFRIGCSLRANGCEEADILSQLTRENKQRCAPPLSQAEVEKCARSAAKYEKGAEKTFPYTEAGDAEFFAFKHKDDVRWDNARKRWLIYDGNRWKPDEVGVIVELAVQAMRDRQLIAVKTPAGDEAQAARRKANVKWTMGGESRNRVTGLLFFAKGLDPIRDDGTNWDTNPDLLCCKPNSRIERRKMRDETPDKTPDKTPEESLDEPLDETTIGPHTERVTLGQPRRDALCGAKTSAGTPCRRRPIRGRHEVRFTRRIEPISSTSGRTPIALRGFARHRSTYRCAQRT